MINETELGRLTSDGETVAASAVWWCLECRRFAGVIKYPGRVGMVKNAHCPTCGGITRQVAESIHTANGSLKRRKQPSSQRV